MEQIPEVEIKREEHVPGTWLDFVIYLLGGLGLFVAVSAVLGYFYREITLKVTLLAILNNIICLGGSVYLLGIRRNKISWAGMGLFPPVWQKKYLPIAAAVAIGILPLRICAGWFVQYLFDGGWDSLQARSDLIFAGGFTLPGFLVVLLGVGILAPISEELYFRGLMYDWFRQTFGVPLAVTFSSVLFALAHIDSVAVVASSLVIAVIIAFAYEQTKSLWVAITMHVVTNTTAVLLTYGAMALTEIYNLPLG